MEIEKKVSVIMSIYNGEEYLESAMESLLSQTYQDWECIAVNDCSTDRSGEILAEYSQKDPRILVLKNEVNLKLPASLNKAMEKAKGKYIMRMDADDICRKDRMEKQVAFMDAHPGLSLSCCRFFTLVNDEIIPACMQRKGDADAVKALFLYFDPVLHPGVIAVRDDIVPMKYNPEYSCTEDLELWTRMLSADKKIGIQDDYLMVYRIHEKQTTATTDRLQRKQYRRIITGFYRENMFTLSPAELEFLTNGIYFRDCPDIGRYLDFARKVRKQNRVSKKMLQKAVTYASFEVFMSYRSELPLSGKQKIKALFSFPPQFVLGEYVRRKRSYKKSMALCREGARIFGLQEIFIHPQSKIPYYRKIQQ